MTKVVRPRVARSSAACNCRSVVGVERAGRLVEDHDRRVFQQRAGDGEALALAAREVAAALADDRRETVRLAAQRNPPAWARSSASVDFRRARVGLADAQVLFDRAREDERLLEHDADVVAQRRKVMSRMSRPSMYDAPSRGS